MKRARLVRRPVIGCNPLYQLENWNGGVPEWLKGTDCKSVGYAYVGSKPTPSTSSNRIGACMSEKEVE